MKLIKFNNKIYVEWTFFPKEKKCKPHFLYRTATENKLKKITQKYRKSNLYNFTMQQKYS